LRRASCVAALITLLVAVPATPAAAHTRAGTATDWRTELTSVPDIEGVTWRLYPTGEYLGLTNDSDEVVTILGYEREPYLRIGPDGVERNANSPTTYLNQRRDGDVSLPPRADSTAAPEWTRVTDEPRYVWLDHRVHRMPKDLRGDDVRWEVPFIVGDAPERGPLTADRLTLTGRLFHDHGPPWWRWLAIGALVTSVALLGLKRDRLQDRIRPAAYVVAGVATFNLIHLRDEVGALPLPALDVAYGIFHNLLFIGIGLTGVAVALRRGTASLLPLGIASGAVAFHQGFLQVQQLGGAELATLWPEAMIRLAVGMSVAQLLWITLLLRFERRRGRLSAREPLKTRGSGAPVPEPALGDNRVPVE
jgi:hypothetical protein